MTREIKFRQWNPFSKSFTYWGYVEKGNFTNPSTVNNVALDTPNEQYTGLKDKNDVEIYESDIVELTDGDYKKRIFSVDYSTDRAMFVQRTPKATRSTYPMPNIDKNMWEIIGNIHKNPELLK